MARLGSRVVSVDRDGAWRIVKGRGSFTRGEVSRLRGLIREKQTADRARQKTLRNSMRGLGFYISDWTDRTDGFTVSDFDALLERGLIAVVDDGSRETDSDADAASMPAIETPSQAAGSMGAREARARREAAAARYRPQEVDLLLVAEAPPAALDRYFYFPDVREQDGLFRHVCRAVLDREPSRSAKADQLAELCSQGVYLIDLQEEPRDEQPLASFVPGLVERCRALDPGWIILIKATVHDAAFLPLRAAGLPVSAVRVPFPGTGQQRRFLEAFPKALAERDSRPAVE
jgi:hypothetical protein